MPRCTYLALDGQERFVWLNERCARTVALMHAATRKRDEARAHAEEMVGAVAWGSPSGMLAAHALALSTVTVVTELLTTGLARPSIDVDLVCKLAAELRPLDAALDTVPLGAFEAVGLKQMLPAPAGACSSNHAAVRAVLADTARELSQSLENCHC